MMVNIREWDRKWSCALAFESRSAYIAQCYSTKVIILSSVYAQKHLTHQHCTMMAYTALGHPGGGGWQ